ncbi:Lipoprotein YafY [Trichinella spiralis]|uniref:Lipoprotein YafY n=2 Tax=Trichinella spiralis TaxID=6334 RepID=A0ABR3KZG1_TRISP|nr:hypothetical protein T01_3148 [Trichinella spiralis]
MQRQKFACDPAQTLWIATVIVEKRFSIIERALSAVAFHFPNKVTMDDKPMLSELCNIKLEYLSLTVILQTQKYHNRYLLGNLLFKSILNR